MVKRSGFPFLFRGVETPHQANCDITIQCLLRVVPSALLATTWKFFQKMSEKCLSTLDIPFSVCYTIHATHRKRAYSPMMQFSPGRYAIFTYWQFHFWSFNRKPLHSQWQKGVLLSWLRNGFFTLSHVETKWHRKSINGSFCRFYLFPYIVGRGVFNPKERRSDYFEGAQPYRQTTKTKGMIR